MAEQILKLNECAHRAHANSVAHGFWADGLPSESSLTECVQLILSKLALITEEVGEAVSAVRHAGTAEDNTGEELADICIRVFDLAVALDINLEQQINHKMAINEKRPFMHGKNS